MSDIKQRLENPGIEPRDIAILCRTNEQPRPFEMELRREKLPYVLIGGQSFYDRREVKDILAYLRVLDNPRDEPSLLRIINTPPRGIGQGTVTTLLEQAVEQGSPSGTLLADVRAGGQNYACRGRGGHASSERLSRAYRQSDRQRIAHRSGHAIDRAHSLPRRFSSAVSGANEQQSRWASVQELINSLAAFEKRAKKPTLRAFLDEVALGERDEAGDKESKLNRNAIALMTLHSAKGLEFPHVYLVGMEEGLLPHQKSVDAEKHGDAKRPSTKNAACATSA